MTDVVVREFDGGRGVTMRNGPDFVVLEVADHCYAFDRALFVRAVERTLDVVILAAARKLDPA